MRRLLRDIAATLAIFATVLTAGVSGAARGKAAAAGEIVICAGQGPVTVRLDSDGNPSGPPHWCPDCVLSLFSAVAAGTPGPAFAGPCIECGVCEPVARAVPALVPAPLARGPPFGA